MERSRWRRSVVMKPGKRSLPSTRQARRGPQLVPDPHSRRPQAATDRSCARLCDPSIGTPIPDEALHVSCACLTSLPPSSHRLFDESGDARYREVKPRRLKRPDRPPPRVAALDQNGWQDCIRTGGRIGSESVAGLGRNTQQDDIFNSRKGITRPTKGWAAGFWDVAAGTVGTRANISV